MRQVDQDAQQQLGIPGLLLMEHAAAGLVREVLRLLVERRLTSHAVVTVVCGPGNNGGDGWAAARMLHLADCPGMRVRVIEVQPPKPGTDAWTNRAIAQASSVPSTAMDQWSRSEDELVIDAVLGTGADRPVDGPALQAIHAIRSASNRGAAVVSADLPSGLDADSGTPLGAAVTATMTVTFAGLKRGLLQESAREFVGRLVVVPIGVPRWLLEKHGRAQALRLGA